MTALGISKSEYFKLIFFKIEKEIGSMKTKHPSTQEVFTTKI